MNEFTKEWIEKERKEIESAPIDKYDADLIIKLIDEVQRLQERTRELEKEKDLLASSLGVYADPSYWRYETVYNKYGENYQWIWVGFYSDPVREAKETLERIT